MRDLPPGASQQDRDTALEPYLLWLTAAQIATRSSARDHHFSLRRSRRAELLGELESEAEGGAESVAESATLAEYGCVTEQKALDAAHETLFRGACARHRRIIDAVHKAASAPIYNAASDLER